MEYEERPVGVCVSVILVVCVCLCECVSVFKMFSRVSGPTDPNSVTNRHCILLTCTKGFTFKSK